MGAREDFEKFLENPKYVAVVHDYYYDTNGNNSRTDGFDDPNKAFEYAKQKAKETGFSSVDYWVEYDFDLNVDGLSGRT